MTDPLHSNLGHAMSLLSNTEVMDLCEQFASVTNTDTATAKMILQENEWNLQRAVSAFLDAPRTVPFKSPLEKTDDSCPTSKTDIIGLSKRFKLLSWNIDGLDENALQTRTGSAIHIIQREQPDAVFLQEVIPVSLQLIRTLLPDYRSYAGHVEGYFVVILLRRAVFEVRGFEIIAYPGTNMNRNLLIVHAIYRSSIEIDLMTSHHESGTEGISSQQRLEQLQLCFQRMIHAPLHRVVLFGGDLNMRERELRTIGGIPPGICDLWIETGKREECAYTWDMNLNTNNNFPFNSNRPRARFDRLYFRSSSDNQLVFQPIFFEFQGLEMIESIQRYCSDHWAIQATFDISFSHRPTK